MRVTPHGGRVGLRQGCPRRCVWCGVCACTSAPRSTSNATSASVASIAHVRPSSASSSASSSFSFGVTVERCLCAIVVAARAHPSRRTRATDSCARPTPACDRFSRATDSRARPPTRLVCSTHLGLGRLALEHLRHGARVLGCLGSCSSIARIVELQREAGDALRHRGELGLLGRELGRLDLEPCAHLGVRGLLAERARFRRE